MLKRETFQIKKRPKRDPKSGVGLLRDLGLPKRDPVGSSDGRKSVDRIGTQTMSKICNLWRLIVVDCDYAESYGRFLSGGNADASHAVYIEPDNS